MTILNIEEDDLLRLTSGQLEQLIARLAEAEIRKHGYSIANVDRPGHLDAKDGRIDIRVEIPTSKFRTDFIARPLTIFQSKKSSILPGKIGDEMKKDNELHPTFSELAKIGGSYIIVSSKDNCSALALDKRRNAMKSVFSNDSNIEKIHLDFYDRSRLNQWVESHPQVAIWAKEKLDKNYSGWKPYGSWSNPPNGSDDRFISKLGVSVYLPLQESKKKLLEEAIEPMRKLIQSSSKAIRITGLSGVGKTRIVQALFDEAIGNNALERTSAVYADIATEPNPSVYEMLNMLVQNDTKSNIIIDNCPPDIHSNLAKAISASDGTVKVITIEYDIRDDKPELTDLIHIEADGPDIAEELVLRRFPFVDPANARKIADFSGGNSRMSLAIAERVKKGENLALISDEELFNRLFEQRKGHDDNLREKAELLSLVYSFSVSHSNMGQSELELLGSISEYTGNQLFRSANILMKRHIIQKRGDMRAILPQPIANKLAKSALENTPVKVLRSAFEAPGRDRLVESFAHRLGMLHDSPFAREIVTAWLQPDDLLGDILNLDVKKSKILKYIAPVVPEFFLDRIEEELVASGFQRLEPFYNPMRYVILDLLEILAYEPYLFDRCMTIFTKMADYEDENNTYKSVKKRMTDFFRPYFSGTHATLEQRIAIVNKCLKSESNKRRQSLVLEFLSVALEGQQKYIHSGHNEFGSRPRDFGYIPDEHEAVEWDAKWHNAFIDIVVKIAISDGAPLQGDARKLLADKFLRLHRRIPVRDKLVAAAEQINSHKYWHEGWQPVRMTIYFDYTDKDDDQTLETLPQDLADLSNELYPDNLISKVKVYLLNELHYLSLLNKNYNKIDFEADDRILAEVSKLGEDFAVSNHQLDDLGFDLIGNGNFRCQHSFGRGLAKGSLTIRSDWMQLMSWLDKSSVPDNPYGDFISYSIVRGFMSEIATSNPLLLQEFIDHCGKHEKLLKIAVNMHSGEHFSEADLDRNLKLLSEDKISPWDLGCFLWRDEYQHLSSMHIDLAKLIMSKPEGSNVIIDAFAMKFRSRKNSSEDVLGLQFRKLGLQASTRILLNDNFGTENIDGLTEVISDALSFDGNEIEKDKWIEAIFSFVDKREGHSFLSFEEPIAITAKCMPFAFLDYLFAGSEEQQLSRIDSLANERVGRSMFSEVDIHNLIDWCQKKNHRKYWQLIANSIPLWQRKNKNLISMTPFSVKFLESAPEPEIVLQIYRNRVKPTSWCYPDYRSDIMKLRADAIRELIQHERSDLADAAQTVLDNLESEIRKIEEFEKLHKYVEVTGNELGFE